jgi:hypothetical protein
MHNLTTISVINDKRKIITNGIPTHQIGFFPNQTVPFAISPAEREYEIAAIPDTSWDLLFIQPGFEYFFGLTLNGILLDPANTEPWKSSSADDQSWTLEHLSSDLGMDCHNATVNEEGQYLYKSSPTAYVYERGFSFDEMTMIGYAADGFPIYYKYAYEDPMDPSSEIIEMISAYVLKSNDRQTESNNAPCGKHDGKFTQDYEFLEFYGDLDECNGRFGITPEYPSGTYYYMLTADFPKLPRCFKSIPDRSFRKSS